MNEGQQIPKTGLFDRKKPMFQEAPEEEPEPTQKPPKEDFQDPFQIQEQMAAEARSRKPLPKNDQEQLADNVNQALSGKDPMKEYEEDMKVDPADIKLAEKLIFDGYAEIDVDMPNIKGHTFTICSTNAEEMSFIDELIYDMIKSSETLKDGTVDLPQNHVNTMRSALFLALGYRGMDKKELCQNSTQYLNTIKRAISMIGELEFSGDLKKAADLKIELKKALKARAYAIRKLPTPVIDFLSQKKYEFDQKMLRVMSTKNILSLQ